MTIRIIAIAALAFAIILIGAVSAWHVSRPAALTPEDVASEWAEGNADVVSDAVAEFVIPRIGGMGEAILGQYVRSNVADALTWSYDARPLSTSADLYDVTATASIRLEDVVVPIVGEDPEIGYIAAAMPHRLTVDLGSMTVIEAHVHPDKATFDTSLPPLIGSTDELVRALNLEGLQAECVASAGDAEVPAYAMNILLKPTQLYERAESIQLGAALRAYGIMDACEPYLDSSS